MTMPTSGKISLFDARTELGLSGPISLQQSEVRGLFEVPSGAISLFDGYGKSAASYPVLVSSQNPVYTNTVSFTHTFTAAAGELCILQMFPFNAQTVSTITSGWTALKNQTGTQTILVYYRYATVTGTQSVTVTLSSATGLLTAAHVISRAAGAPKINTTWYAANTRNVGFGSITTTKNKSLLLGVANWQPEINTLYTQTPPLDWIERLDASNANAANRVMVANTLEVDSTGTVLSSVSSTASGNVNSIGALLEVLAK